MNSASCPASNPASALASPGAELRLSGSAAIAPMFRAAPPIALPAGGNDLLWWIVEATSGATGDDFFNALVSRLAMVLKLKYVLVTECLEFPARRVHTLAYWVGSALVPNIEYDLEGTPCKGTIIGQQVCFIPRDVRKQFPPPGTEPDQVSYYGIPIFDSARERVIGHFAFLDDKVMESEVFGNPVFHIFASRAAAELQRRHAEEEARTHLQQLAHAARAGSMGEPAGAIAHEVNQPLTAITAYARACVMLLAQSGHPGDDTKTALDGVLQEAERAAAITRRLRGFLSRRDSDFYHVSPNLVAQESLELARSDARQLGIKLQSDLDFSLPDVYADPVQLEQVVFNLLRNALDALPPAKAGEAGSGAPRWGMVSTAKHQDGIAISVADNGTGIAPAVRERLFHPFFTTKQDGMGIGLSLSRTIAQKAGGTLDLDDTYTRGARFVLVLPAAGAADSTDAAGSGGADDDPQAEYS